MDKPSPLTNNNTDMRHDKRERDGVEREQKYKIQLGSTAFVMITYYEN